MGSPIASWEPRAPESASLDNWADNLKFFWTTQACPLGRAGPGLGPSGREVRGEQYLPPFFLSALLSGLTVSTCTGGGSGGSMLAVHFDQPGGPENLYLKEVAKPEPGPGEVLVKVAASALNRADVLQV